MSVIKKNHFKFDTTDGSVVNEIREPILYRFAINKPSGYKVFCEPEKNKYKNCDSYCVGGRHRLATTKVYRNITSKDSKVLIGYCSICNKNKPMTVSDNTKQAEGLGSFSKIWEKFLLKPASN